MAKLIAISGACHSGKTTKIRELKAKFGSKLVVVDECIRHKDHIVSIDEIRADPVRYMEFQFDVIREKFENEQTVIREHPNSVVITDRSMADSFFYFIFYVDKSRLDRTQLERYSAFFKWLYFRVLTSAKCYDHIFLFRPIPIHEEDPLRPGNLDILQDVEFFFIKTLVLGFYHSNVTEIDANNPNDVSTLHSLLEAFVSKS